MAALFASPHVSIFVDESASQAITMVGEVNHPGPYPAIGERRLFDMISAAGGLTDKAGRIVTIVHRDDPDHKVELQLSSNLAEDTQNNVDVIPGDTIIVSRAGIVYVVGDVQHPSGFLIEDNSLSVLKALALAGGSTRTSALNKTKILRQTPNGIQEIPVPLKKVLYAKAPDMRSDEGRRSIYSRKCRQSRGLSHCGRGHVDDDGSGGGGGASVASSSAAVARQFLNATNSRFQHR